MFLQVSLAYETDQFVYDNHVPLLPDCCWADESFLSFHDGKIPPKVLKTGCAAEKCGEVR
jgi:hypothetical protein